MTDDGLLCAYCGARHRRAAEVRACWARGATATADGEEAAALAEEIGAGPVPAAANSERGPGPDAGVTPRPVLGRSVIVRPGAVAPAGWERCARASGELEELEEAWRTRTPLVIEVDEEPSAEEVERRPVWSLSPDFAFTGERRRHAIFANALDLRDADHPRFALAQRAVELGALPGGSADVLLADGRPAYCDGGPFAWGAAGDAAAAVLSRCGLLAGSLVPLGANETAAGLAPDQLAAVTHAGGAARIIAPAGSGKTRVLTERARHLLRAAGLPGRCLTLVAFNRRAAQEMRERTPDLPELRVHTLNALGLSLLGGGVTTLDEREVRAILDRLVDLPRRANTDPAAAWIEALSAVRLGLVAPEEVEASYDGDVDGLPEVVDRYRRVLAERNAVDFDEQVYGAIEVLLADPQRRAAARTACRMMLVDEFQDLTPAHLLLIRLLAGPDGAVFGVGDDDQTIYGYTGASPQWLIEYDRYFPTAGAHALEVNYRCPPAVVDGARTLLTHNRRRVDKVIRPAPGRLNEPDALRVLTSSDPLGDTVRIVKDLAARVAPAEIAVLTRVNAALAPVQVALVHAGVPAEAAVDLSYLSRGGVQVALAWLRLAVSPARRLAGADIALALRRPARGASPRLVEWASEQRDLAGLERLARRVTGRDSDKIGGFVDDLRAVAASAVDGTTAGVLRTVRDAVGLDRAMALLEGARRHLDRSAQTDDLDALVALGALHPDPAGFEDFLRDALARPGDPAGVALATIHRVKGREWPHVVLHDVTAGVLPHRLVEDREEERRVFHVGLTRAAQSAAVVAGEPPSPFLRELTSAAVPGESEEPPVAPKAAAPAAHRPAPATADGDERARAALRAWRAARAAREKKPAYIYLHDRTIEAIVASMPSTPSALAAVPGIGPSKLDAYGEEILSVLAGLVEGEGRAAGTEAHR